MYQKVYTYFIFGNFWRFLCFISFKHFIFIGISDNRQFIQVIIIASKVYNNLYNNLFIEFYMFFHTPTYLQIIFSGKEEVHPSRSESGWQELAPGCGV